ncbi:MAG: hypothetical protein QNI99_09380 [Woeseiaceae bacterium]|nr:hypothetical protein [Woeseiaceae bacterium]
MRRLLRTALPFLLVLTSAASAVEIEVGGRTLDIPIPEGYAELTPEMSPTYDAMYAYVVPTNDRHLILIPRENAEAILRGKDVEIGRYMMIESEKQSSRFDLTQGDFDELRSTMRGEIDEMWEAARQELPGVFDDVSESMSETLDADIQMSVGEIIPMEVHLDTDDIFAFSQIISIGVALEGEDLGTDRMIATVAVTRARSKLIFLMVYGFEDDLEWTREQAADLANQILAANPTMHEAQLDSTRGAVFEPVDDSIVEQRGIDWSQVLERTLIGALIGGIVGLFAFALSRRRKTQD